MASSCRASAEDNPGELYTLEPEQPENGDSPAGTSFDAHAMNPASVLQLVKAMGGRCGHMTVVGCEPATVEPNPEVETGLSAPRSGR